MHVLNTVSTTHDMIMWCLWLYGIAPRRGGFGWNGGIQYVEMEIGDWGYGRVFYGDTTVELVMGMRGCGGAVGCRE